MRLRRLLRSPELGQGLAEGVVMPYIIVQHTSEVVDAFGDKGVMLDSLR